ncbi:MAG: dihydroorotase [Candidatus Omnitrophica bacterium]|nr:dihydroorotase [Candidatus Omnitrophota bacterium]
MKYLIKNGHVIDPKNKIDAVMDVLISGVKIEKVAKSIEAKDAEVIDAKDRIVAPGLIDMHVHLREPGREDKETVATGTHAAVCSGVTSVCCMPNTEPAIDNPKEVKALKDIIKRTAVANVFIVGAITKDRDGKKIVDVEGMKKAGVVALSDDGNSVEDPEVMLKALKQAKKNSTFLMPHCEDKKISDKGVMNEGIIATKLGLRAMPKKAEYEIVKRDIELAKKAGARLHIAHVSCKESIDIIRKAKKDGIKVTAEATPHHFSLTDECVAGYDTNTKVDPPLRSREDVDAVKKAISDGTIDVIASDHAPHGKHEKDVEYDYAAFGMIGLETSFPLAVMNLIDTKLISWQRLVELMSLNPAKILGLGSKGSLSAGSDADIVIIDPSKQWVYKEQDIKSKSKNSPFIGKTLKGAAVVTIVGGKIAYKA